MDIEYVFLTHMHSDHMGGIANLINLSYVNGRRTVAHIYGPDDSKNLTHSLYPPTSKEYRAGYETITPFGIPDTREINELDADDLRNGLVWDTDPYPVRGEGCVIIRQDGQGSHANRSFPTSPAYSREFLERAGSEDKTIKIYDGSPHAVLFDTKKELAYEDIFEWLDERAMTEQEPDPNIARYPEYPG